LTKHFPPNGVLPSTETTRRAYFTICGDMEVEAKANQRRPDIPSYDTFALLVGRARRRPYR
jgi:hypothetical protein